MDKSNRAFMVAMWNPLTRHWLDTGARLNSYPEAEIASCEMHAVVQDKKARDHGVRFKAMSVHQWNDR